MSMNTYPIYVPAALVITPELAAVINGWRLEKSSISPKDQKEWCKQNDFDITSLPNAFALLAAYLNENVDVEYCSSFTGTIVPIKKDGATDHRESKSFSGNDIAYIPCCRDADLFRAAYGSYKELVEEFREVLKPIGDVLADFPLETCIYSVAGISFG